MIDVDTPIQSLSKLGFWQFLNYMESLSPIRRQMLLQALRGLSK